MYYMSYKIILNVFYFELYVVWKREIFAEIEDFYGRLYAVDVTTTIPEPP